jgi:hypothetical protein
MEYYIYDSYVPIIDENTGEVTGYDQQKMSVNIPHTASVLVLSLEKYENIAADYAELPTISGTAITHTQGTHPLIQRVLLDTTTQLNLMEILQVSILVMWVPVFLKRLTSLVKMDLVLPTLIQWTLASVQGPVILSLV